MASTLVNILLAVVAIGIGVGITIVARSVLNLDLNMQILIGIVMTLASFTSLYFMTKSHN